MTVTIEEITLGYVGRSRSPVWWVKAGAEPDSIYHGFWDRTYVSDCSLWGLIEAVGELACYSLQED